MLNVQRIKHYITGGLSAVSIVTVALALSTSPVMAQKKAAKKVKMQNPWVKLCRKIKDAKACTIRIDEVDRLSLQSYSPVTIEHFKGKATFLKATLPHTWAIPLVVKNKKTKKEQRIVQPMDLVWDIQKNAFLQIGDKGKKIPLKFNQCNAFGCIAVIKMTDALLGQLKKGKKVGIAGYSRRMGKPHGMSFPLKDFGKTYDGDPQDEKIYVQALNKKIASFVKRRRAFVKKRNKAIVAARKKAAEKK